MAEPFTAAALLPPLPACVLQVGDKIYYAKVIDGAENLKEP